MTPAERLAERKAADLASRPCRHHNQRDLCPDCTPGRIMAPVPQRPAGPYCPCCGLPGGHSIDVPRVHFGCDGREPDAWTDGDPIPLRHPDDPPVRPWVAAALAYGGEA